MRFLVNDQKITTTDSIFLVSETVGVYVAEFIFTQEWYEYTKTAVFKTENDCYEILLDSSNRCFIPNEIMDRSGYFSVGVYGIAPNKVYPTVWSSEFFVRPGTTEGREPTPPTPDIYQQIITALASKYQKPASGIPKSDLDDSVKSSLDKADSALQEHQSLEGYATEDFVLIVTAPIEDSITEHASDLGIHVTELDKEEWGGKYQKPASGIPKSDLDDSVKSSLDKADSALQEHQDISEKADTTYVDEELAKKQDLIPENTYDVYGAALVVQNDLNTVKEKIPPQATSSNQLADKDFVNSTVGTNTAIFRGTYDVVSDLGLTKYATHEQIAEKLTVRIIEVTNNDYCFVSIPGEVLGAVDRYDRYKYSDGNSAWAFEFSLNNSSFTSGQWAAINSGMNTALVSEIESHVSDTDIHVTPQEKERWDSGGVSDDINIIGTDKKLKDLTNIAVGFAENGETVKIPDEFVPNVSALPKDMRVLGEYSNEIWYSDVDYDQAFKFFENHEMPLTPGACTAVSSGRYFGRNFDWYYNDIPEYIVHTEKVGNRHATIGTAALLGFELTQMETKKLLPFFILDGINDCGLSCCTNVVPTDYGKSTESIPAVSEEISISAKMINRYILDHFSTARDAAEYMRDHMAIRMPSYLHEINYEVHWMIADRNETLIIEILNNAVEIIEDVNPIITNFYIHGVTFDSDGKVIINRDGSGENASGVTKYGSGLERYNLAVDSLSSIGSADDMKSLMHSLYYTNAYDLNRADLWYTEFVGGNLDVTSPTEDYSYVLSVAAEMYEKRSRDPESPYFGTWQTTHSVVFDLDELEAFYSFQESGTYENEASISETDNKDGTYIWVSEEAPTNSKYNIWIDTSETTFEIQNGDLVVSDLGGAQFGISNGDLTVNSVDENNYSIDDDGDLIYNGGDAQ